MRLKNRVGHRQRKLMVEKADLVMQALVDEVFKVVPAEKFKTIATHIRKAKLEVKLTFHGYWERHKNPKNDYKDSLATYGVFLRGKIFH